MYKTLFLLLAWVLVACNAPFEAPQFVEIKEGQITHLHADQLEIEAVGVMYNPNPVALELQAVDLEVFFDEQSPLAQIKQTKAVSMPAKAAFEFPIKAYCKPSEVYGDSGGNAIRQALKIVLNQEK